MTPMEKKDWIMDSKSERKLLSKQLYQLHEGRDRERNREWVDCEVEQKKCFFLIKFYFRKNSIKMKFNSLKKLGKIQIGFWDSAPYHASRTEGSIWSNMACVLCLFALDMLWYGQVFKKCTEHKFHPIFLINCNILWFKI